MPDQPEPEEAGAMILDNLQAVLKGLNEREELLATLASIMKKFHGALIDAGFTEDQAIRIVAGFAAKAGK